MGAVRGREGFPQAPTLAASHPSSASAPAAPPWRPGSPCSPPAHGAGAGAPRPGPNGGRPCPGRSPLPFDSRDAVAALGETSSAIENTDELLSSNAEAIELPSATTQAVSPAVSELVAGASQVPAMAWMVPGRAGSSLMGPQKPG